MQANFPDKEYLKKLVGVQAKKVADSASFTDLLIMYSGARLNWLADFFTDPNVRWSKRMLKIDDLSFTRTNPEWNKILIDACGRSPAKLRKLLTQDKNLRDKFSNAVFTSDLILVRKQDDKLMVLDGTHRLVGAILEGKSEIEAYVAELKGNPKPACEPHVVYDLIRAYQRGNNRDRKGLAAALKFLCIAYNNVEDLLRNRFGTNWITEKEIRKIIAETLTE